MPSSSLARAWTGRAGGSWRKGSFRRAPLKVEGGEIEVRAEELPSGGRRIVSVGRVVERSAPLAARFEIAVMGVPAPAAPPPPADLSATP